MERRTAELEGPAEPEPAVLKHRVRGYLAGHYLLLDGARVHADVSAIVDDAESVHLVEAGLDRFARISAGRPAEGAPLIFIEEEMPLGPENDVLSAFLDRRNSLDGIRGVPPALDAAFRMEVWRRQQAADRRAHRRAEVERRARAVEAVRALGDGAWRRTWARHDFSEAAQAALAVGGATYLDDRASPNSGERIVRFRLDDGRYECVCDERSLRIIDAGVCLVDDETNESGDDRFTLESLPGVIRQAIREDVLVVFRHVE